MSAGRRRGARLRFTLYALSDRLGVDPGADRAALGSALDGATVRTTLTGRFGRA